MAANLEVESGAPHYRYYLAYTISGELALEVDFTAVTWSRQIRRAGAFTGALSFGSPGDDEPPGARTADDRLIEAYGGTMPGKMSVFITRDSLPVWGGFISRRSYDPSTRVLTVEATGFEAHMYTRSIWHDVSYPITMDQYDVVRNLISAMQTDFSGVAVTSDIAVPKPDNANIGIHVSQVKSGKTQDAQKFSGFQLQRFGEVIEGYSNNLNGFEYNIEIGWDANQNKFTKEFVFRDTPPSQLPQGAVFTGVRTGIDQNYFEYPGNILTMGYEDTIDASATRYFVTGLQPEPIGDIEPPTPRGVWANDAYLATEWPIIDQIESSEHSNVSLQSTLNAYAKSYGQRAKPPAPSWTVTVNGSSNPQVGSYVPGDWCTLVVTDPFIVQGIGSSGTQTRVFTKRIADFSVAVPDTEQYPEVVTLTLIDEWDLGT